MFMGQYNHSVDAKGRLIIPAKYREELGEEFVITKNVDKCLTVYSKEEWKNVEGHLRELTAKNKNARKYMRFVFANASFCEPDKQGRVILNSALREYAGIEKDVVLIGVMDHIEIWSAQNWSDESQDEEMEEIAEQMAELGFGI